MTKAVAASRSIFQRCLWRQMTAETHISSSSFFCTKADSDPSSSYLQKVRVTQKSVKDHEQDIELELSVVDTHPSDRERPTIFGIHGCPGSGADFEPLITQLSSRGIRFVAPTFPGFEPSIVEPWKLLHMDYSTEGRASLVKSIVEEMKVDRIDMLMCHSAGSWTGYKIAAEWPSVHSLCLLNPTGARPHKSLRPYIVVKIVAWILRQRSLHFLLMPLMEKIYTMIGFSGVKGGEHLMVTQEIVASQGFENMPGFAAKIRDRSLPFVFSYTLNDKIIESAVSEEMLMKHLGVPPKDVLQITEKDKATSDSGTSEGRHPRGLQFARGGHIVHKAYPEIILQHILSVLPSHQTVKT